MASRVLLLLLQSLEGRSPPFWWPRNWERQVCNSMHPSAAGNDLARPELAAICAAGLEMLKEVANVDCSYNLTPEELYAKIAESDALIVRSATKVGAVAKTATKRS